jgi:peptide-methionine (S)-S-oxide reductase
MRGKIIAIACMLVVSTLFLGFAAGVTAGTVDHGDHAMAPLPDRPAGSEVATFAGGCFWCVESDFDKVPGVISTTSGFTGGHVKDPDYEQVSAGGTGHAESVLIVFDPAKVSYAQLLDVFWHSIDPVTPDAQFCDHGNQYRSAIFYQDEAQKEAAERSRDAIAKSGVLPGPIVTQIVPAATFYPAEVYHQGFYKKNPVRYKFYRYTCGRDRRLHDLWGDAAGGHAAVTKEGSHG